METKGTFKFREFLAGAKMPPFYAKELGHFPVVPELLLEKAFSKHDLS